MFCSLVRKTFSRQSLQSELQPPAHAPCCSPGPNPACLADFATAALDSTDHHEVSNAVNLLFEIKDMWPDHA